MMKVVINPSWNCQLACEYCWLPHTKINRSDKEHAWGEWATALKRIIPRGSIVDVAGGEPLLYPDLTKLLAELGRHGILWAITSNGLSNKGVKELTAEKVPGCVVINISDHAGNVKASKNIEKLRAMYPVNVHRCDHKAAGKRESAKPITYQAWAENDALDGVTRFCDAGINHLVIDPVGDVFRCCVDMQVANEPLFNLFGESLEYAQDGILCDFGCSSCYTENPGEWMIKMEPINARPD